MRRGQLTYSILNYNKSKEELQYEINNYSSDFYFTLKWEVPDKYLYYVKNIMLHKIFTFEELKQQIYESLSADNYLEVEALSMVMNEFNKKGGDFVIICNY